MYSTVFQLKSFEFGFLSNIIEKSLSVSTSERPNEKLSGEYVESEPASSGSLAALYLTITIAMLIFDPFFKDV